MLPFLLLCICLCSLSLCDKNDRFRIHLISPKVTDNEDIVTVGSYSLLISISVYPESAFRLESTSETQEHLPFVHLIRNEAAETLDVTIRCDDEVLYTHQMTSMIFSGVFSSQATPS